MFSITENLLENYCQNIVFNRSWIKKAKHKSQIWISFIYLFLGSYAGSTLMGWWIFTARLFSIWDSNFDSLPDQGRLELELVHLTGLAVV